MRRLPLLLFTLLLVPLVATTPERAVLEGTVVDAVTGGPLPGVNVEVVGTQASVTTEADGTYRLEDLPAGTHTVRFALVGYARLEREVTLAAGAPETLDVRMHPARQVLEEAVVAGEPTAVYDMAAPMTIRKQAANGAWRHPHPGFNTESYDYIEENTFRSARQEPLSTFSIDVDGASYSNVRRFLQDGQRPPADAVRVEEMVNYFDYDYPQPTGETPFAVVTEVGAAPWQPAHRLVHVGLQGRALPEDERPASNLVFLLDVSGSMNSPDKLPLLKQGFRMLTEELRPEDRVAIVVYAGSSGLVLPSTPGDRKAEILEALSRLQAGGSTAGAAGLRQAYEVARQHFVEDGNNRVILATDGDFNVGLSSDAAMVRLIEEERASGVFLTVLGFGTGNLKDSKMEKLAGHGNGNYYYLDGPLEAKKVLVSELGSTLFTIAKDVKIQVEFNPATVAGYRLVGYENRLLADEDFDDDTKDAGELGAGHTVTALYEVIPVGAETDVVIPTRGTLKYQDEPRTTNGSADELMTVKLRYKEPDGEASRLLEQVVRVPGDRVQPSDDFTFSAAVASFGMLLRDSAFKGEATTARVLRLAREARGEDPHGYRAEFIRLVEAFELLEGVEAAR